MTDARALADALGDAVELLRSINGDPTARDALVAAYRTNHAAFNPVLLEDAPPGSVRVERDLHLQHPELGGVSIAWREQDGSPWALLYADHWAAQYVFSVDNIPVTIRSALTSMRMQGAADAALLDGLIEAELIGGAVRALNPRVTKRELQNEVDHLRRALGLHEAASLGTWLELAGLTEDEFIASARSAVQRRKWVEQVASPHVKGRFETRPEDYIRVAVLLVTAKSSDAAERIWSDADAGSPWQKVERHLADVAHAELHRCFSFEADALMDGDERRILFSVDHHAEAVLDDATREAIKQRIVAEWVREKRATAAVRWYWP